MDRPFANRLYLIIIVVISMTIGFISGYIVGSKHSENSISPNSSKQKRLSDPMLEGTGEAKKVAGESPLMSKDSRSEIATNQDIKKQPQGTGGSEDQGQKELPPQSLEGRKESEGAIQTSDFKQKKAEGSTQNEKKERPLKEVFTVQAGAFKDKKEAETLKTKLEKKGYNITIVKETGKGGTFFKVRIGVFDTKKEAELFAIKLRKTEGLHAFAIKR